MREHGTYARYKADNCRCYPCSHANSNYQAARERAIAYGTWQPWTDAEPARQHVQLLQAEGVGTRSIAKAAGLSRPTIQYLLAGRDGRPAPAKIRPATAAAILAVDLTLDTLPTSARIPATGTRRRTEALAAAGWPRNHIARHAGIIPTDLTAALQTGRVTVATAHRIRDTYNQLWDTDPAAHGVAPWAIEKTRRRAAANKWAPPAAWDDDWLDLPDADLAAELPRLAALMDDTETGRCYRDHLAGDHAPLTTAGAAEHNRRRVARRAAQKETAA